MSEERKAYRIDVPFEDKCWGEVQHIFDNEHVAVSGLLAWEEGYRCSKHFHKQRANMFFVLGGVIDVFVGGEKESDPYARWELARGDVFVVPSGIWHEFHVIASATIVEVYWPDRGGVCDINDIVRADVGGPI